jgi:hypothetical protein
MVAPRALGCRGNAWGSVKKGLNKIVTGWWGSLRNVPKRPH